MAPILWLPLFMATIISIFLLISGGLGVNIPISSVTFQESSTNWSW